MYASLSARLDAATAKLIGVIHCDGLVQPGVEGRCLPFPSVHVLAYLTRHKLPSVVCSLFLKYSVEPAH